MSVQLAPDPVTVLLSLEFDGALRVPEIEKIVAELEDRIRKARPDVILMFVAAIETRIRKGANPVLARSRTNTLAHRIVSRCIDGISERPLSTHCRH
jgi:hypothetical protein